MNLEDNPMYTLKKYFYNVSQLNRSLRGSSLLNEDANDNESILRYFITLTYAANAEFHQRSIKLIEVDFKRGHAQATWSFVDNEKELVHKFYIRKSWRNDKSYVQHIENLKEEVDLISFAGVEPAEGYYIDTMFHRTEDSILQSIYDEIGGLDNYCEITGEPLVYEFWKQSYIAKVLEQLTDYGICTRYCRSLSIETLDHEDMSKAEIITSLKIDQIVNSFTWNDYCDSKLITTNFKELESDIKRGVEIRIFSDWIRDIHIHDKRGMKYYYYYWFEMLGRDEEFKKKFLEEF